MDQLNLFAAPSAPTIVPASVSAAVSATAGALPEQVRLGCSSWTFAGWRGHVYANALSDERMAREGLRAYGQHPLLRAVSIDRTFHGPIDAPTFARYAGQVPPGFRFMVKAHADCTMVRFPEGRRHGARAGETNARWLEPGYARDVVVGPAIEGLGDALGVMLFQFSPGHAHEGAPEAFAERLHAFLDRLPTGPVYAVELRDQRLFGPAYAQALSAAGAVHCFTGHPAMPTIDFQRLRLPAVHQPAVVIRWNLARGHTHQSALRRFAPFDTLRAADMHTRKTIAQLCRQAAARDRPAYVIIGNNAEGCAPASVVELAGLLH